MFRRIGITAIFLFSIFCRNPLASQPENYSFQPRLDGELEDLWLKSALELRPFISTIDGSIRENISGYLSSDQNGIYLAVVWKDLPLKLAGGFRYRFNAEAILRDDRLEVQIVSGESIYNFAVNTWASKAERLNGGWTREKNWFAAGKKYRDSYCWEVFIPFSCLELSGTGEIRYNVLVYQNKPRNIFSYARVLGDTENYSRFPSLTLNASKETSGAGEKRQVPAKPQAVSPPPGGEYFLVEAGRKTMPLGWWFHSNRKEFLKEVAGTGANVIYYYLSNELSDYKPELPVKMADLAGLFSILEEAHRNHLKVVVGISSILGAFQCNKAFDSKEYTGEYLKAVVHLFKDHPAVFGWWLGEEPELHDFYWNEAADLKILYETIKAMDPQHPVFLAHCHQEYLQAYQDTADIVCQEFYYLPSSAKDPDFNSLNRVFRDMDKVRSYLRTNKPVHIIPQVFNWKKEREGGRDPSIEDVRGMVYAGLLAGGKGVEFFYWHNDEKDFDSPSAWPLLKKEITALIAQIKKIGLADPDKEWQKEDGLRADNGNLEIWKWEDKTGRPEYLVLNKSREPIAFKIEGFKNKEGKIEDGLKNRTVQIREGKIDDKVEPFGIVYYRNCR